MKLEHSLKPYTKINSKWIKDLNGRPDSIKLLEENTGRTLYDIHQSKILLDPPPREMEIKTKIGLGGVTFKHGAGPLLRSYAEGDRQHVERRASGVWSTRVCRDSLIHQRADSRSKKNYNPEACGTKTTFTER